MSTHHLGRKYTCYSCHTKFYDLGKAAPICPKCGSDQRDADDAPAPTSHRGRRAAAPPVEPPPPPALEADFEVEEEDFAGPDAAAEEEDFAEEAEVEVETPAAEEEEDDDDEDEDF